MIAGIFEKDEDAEDVADAMIELREITLEAFETVPRPIDVLHMQ
jgi:hypothetical protein